MYRTTPVPPAKFEGQRLVHPPNEPAHEGEDRADECGGQTTTESLADALHKYAADRIVRHVGGCANVGYVVRWYGYTSSEDTVELPAHFIACYCQRLDKKNAEQIRCGQGLANRTRKLPK